MITIKRAATEYLHSIIDIVEQNDDILKPNNLMIYYLCCTFFKDSSFVAFKDKETIGFILSFTDFKNKSVWIHQLGIHPDNKKRGIGSRLFEKLEETIKKKEKSIKKIQLAVKADNVSAKKFYLKHGFIYSKMDKIIEMEIYEKRIDTTPNNPYSDHS